MFIRKYIFLTVAIFFGMLLPILAHADNTSKGSRGLARPSGSHGQQATPFTGGVFRAIVIGNNAYRDPEGVWKPLSTAVADAKSISKLLRHEYGFADIDLIVNGTRRSILNSLTKMSKRVRNNDSVLLYYAGHGYRNASTQEAFWIPVDAEGWDDSFFLSNARIKEKLAVISDRVKHTLMVSDSCFSGTLLRGGNIGLAQVEQNEPFYKKIAHRKSVQILAAGGVEYVDDNFRNSGHSPFTYFLLKELQYNNNRYFTASTLSAKLARTVANNVQQTPQSGVLHGAGDEGGEFIFARRNVARATKNKTAEKPISIDPMAVELSYWNSVKEIDEPKLYLAYLKRFPNGAFADIARHKTQYNSPPKHREIDEISEVIGRYKLNLEARDLGKIQQISYMSQNRKQFMRQFLQQYKSFKINVSGINHIKKSHEASAKIQIVNLLNNDGKYVRPGAWGQFDIRVRKSSKGQWRVYW